MKNAAYQSIPKLDLKNFTKGNREQREQFVNDLSAAYESIGFVAVRNHGVSEDLLERFYQTVEDFFNLPETVKMQYSEPGGQRGYTPFGIEHAKDRNEGDLKEFWHFGQEVIENNQLKDFYPKNMRVKELEAFYKEGMELYRSLEQCGREILKAIAIGLNLNENYFENFVINGNSILRPIHYPPILSAPKSAIRAGEHEDINLITLLVGASADGLEVLNRDNQWIKVTTVQDHIVVNVGDMLQRLTNDKLKSTTHRVVNPPKEQWHKSRYSIPFFLHPVPNMKLDCLENCCSDENPKKYKDINAIDFLFQRLREIGLIK